MIRTKASLAKLGASSDTFQVVKFDETSRKRLPKTAPPTKPTGHKSESEDSEFERVFGDGPKRKKPKKGKSEVTFQSARREIINFGIAGSGASEKVNLNQQLAIKLGAKPLKKPARNYKEILEEKRQQKEQNESVNKRTIFGTSASLQYRSQKRKAGRKDVGLLKRYGKVEKDDNKPQGRFDNKRKR